MSKDFRTTQLRVNKIINTAITPGDPLLVYGLSSATNDSGGIASSHFAGTGSDVWMFISGAANSADVPGSAGTTVFQGDVVFSGTMQVAEVISPPATPASGKGVIYAKNDSLLYFKNDAGTEYNLTAGGGGSPAAPSGSLQFNDGTSFGGSAKLKWIDESLYITGSLNIVGDINITGSITPSADTIYNLGSSSRRWANVYTGDLHLRNDRGDWTIVEEKDFLCVVNNLTGKKFKMMLEPLD